MLMKISDKMKTITGVVLAICLVAMIGIFVDANINHYTAGMQSDIASEGLFAALMYERGTYRPDTWYISSAIHVITVPNLASLIYPLTGFNLNLSMGIACSVMLILMLSLMLAYLRSSGFSVIHSISVILILLSLTKAMDEVQVMIMLYAMDYISHFITLFTILLLYNYFLRSGRIYWWGVMLSCGFAVANGIQGMHACLFCYLPLLGAEFLRQLFSLISDRKLRSLSVSLWVLGLTLCTLITNKVSGVYNPSPSRNIRHALEKLIREALPSVGHTLFSGRLVIITLIMLIMAIAGYFIMIVRIVKEKEFEKSDDSILWGMLMFPIGFFICLFMTVFTTSQVADRYYIMLLFSVAVGTVWLIRRFSKEMNVVLGLVLIVYVVSAETSFYQKLIVEDNSKNTDAYKAYEWMRDNGYDYGYTTFEHANYITVMGNNTVKVRCVNNMHDMEGSKWLSDRLWYPPYKDASGETCYLVSEYMQEDFDEFLKENSPKIVRSENIGYYTVYVLDHDYTVWER